MKNYFRNEIIIKENEYLDKVFEIIKGNILEENTNRIYSKGDLLFIDKIYYNSYATSNYLSLNLVSGKWINKNEITTKHLSILANMYQSEKIHNELLLINDPLIKVSKYLLYEYKNKKTQSFYIDKSLSDLAIYLNINKKSLSDSINHLISKQIIAKHNKLFNIINITQLNKQAYLKDYII